MGDSLRKKCEETSIEKLKIIREKFKEANKIGTGYVTLSNYEGFDHDDADGIGEFLYEKDSEQAQKTITRANIALIISGVSAICALIAIIKA